MYAMNIKNDVIGLVLCENCKSKQVTDFNAWPSRCHDTIQYFIEVDLRKVDGFLHVLWFPSTKKNGSPQYNWKIVESGVKHHNSKPTLFYWGVTLTHIQVT